MEQIKPFSINFSIDFTNENLSTKVDLGCVILCKVWKEYGYGKLVEGYVVIDKKTGNILPLDGKEIVFDKVINDNEKSPQEKYFMLRFSDGKDAVIYTTNGTSVKLENYKARESNVHCGKNIVAFAPAWHTDYLLFNPLTGKRIDVQSMLSKYNIEIKDNKVSVNSDTGDIIILEGGRSFRVSEDLTLSEVAPAT